jgi:hypothetical protein
MDWVNYDRSLAVAARIVRSLTLAALIALTGCGVPGEPLPPLLEIPAAVEDLAVTQVGAQLELEWSRPRLTTEGTRPQRLNRIEIYATFDSAGAAVEVPNGADLVEAISLRDVPETADRMKHMITLEASRIGAHVVVGLKAINDHGRDAGFSNVVRMPIVDIPRPPTNLEGELTERAVRLRWTAAAQSVFGGAARPVDGYQVFRREAAAPGAGSMIGEVQATEFEDTVFAFDRTYVYEVRAFVRRDGATAVTPLSGHAEIAAIDRFPPRAPDGVRAVAGPGAVEISWSPSEEEDLAGYYVYRSEGGEFKRVNEELVRIPVFRDAAVRPGIEYRYEVRAMDRKGNESTPSAAVSIAAE